MICSFCRFTFTDKVFCKGHIFNIQLTLGDIDKNTKAIILISAGMRYCIVNTLLLLKVYGYPKLIYGCKHAM